MAKTCPTDSGVLHTHRVEANATRLTEDQFDEVKHLQQTGELSSLTYSIENEVPIAEVNRAVTSRNYREYVSF